VLPADDVTAEVPIRPAGVAGDAQGFGKVENDGHRKDVVSLRQLHQLASRLALHVGGVDDRQTSGCQAFAGDVAQHVERVCRCALVVLVVGNQTPARVGGDHLVAAEVVTRKGRLPRTRGTQERHQRQLGDGQDAGAVFAVCVGAAHDVAFASSSVRVNRASWVGGPTCGSSSPIGSKRTV
jgi:hypothetical protein